MPSIAEQEAEIIEEFSLADDWEIQTELILDHAKQLKPMDAAYKTEVYRIRGCISQVWLKASYQDGLVHFEADSDSELTKGLIALLIRVLDQQTPQAIAHASLGFMEQIGLKSLLTSQRQGGLAAMVKQMKHYAIAFSQTKP